MYYNNTCRNKAHHARQTHNIKLQTEIANLPEKNISPVKTKIDSLSAPGIGNATLGTLAADGLKSLFTPIDNKPATKGELKK
ncbi:hypothetical protein [Siansivirga zeaxanthinifaciens]|uniref:Uncharacterized protein n=1 Tax=Siansivirga zeaxanthinifaciens CC-SAMT-1 TaxID=1454006 RepID=A0A0C5WCY5_9FLAO|nr:hypothetical protein [Siansivirga zeaxanthinifaciens]AJR04918.1 hypothetical protein AW14_09795 [Siansivirga zeaxanthinifaciens CC-SAMT-1]